MAAPTTGAGVSGSSSGSFGATAAAQRELQRDSSSGRGIQRERRAPTSELIQRGLVAYGVISN